ncbi:hypothetical protein ACHAW6_006650 [Cyclotella cf. meneghiniana]
MAPRPQSPGPKQRQGQLQKNSVHPIGSHRENPAPTSTWKGPARTESVSTDADDESHIKEHKPIDGMTCNGNGKSQAAKSDLNSSPSRELCTESPATKPNDDNNDALQAHHVHFSPRPTMRRFPSQTKAWTDQAAPEPFSTPNKNRHRKLGYGDLFAKNGAEVVTNSFSYPHSHHAGKSGCSGFVIRRSVSGDIHNKNLKEKAVLHSTSFTKQDFPSLSPNKLHHSSAMRMQSWSSVVGRSERSIHQNNRDAFINTDQSALDSIPPPPLIENAPQVLSKDESNQYLPAISHMSLSYPPPFTNQLHDLHTSSSPHHQPPRDSSLVFPSYTSNNHLYDYSPFDAFTTMSRSALQNDIGTLLARYNRVEEAMERYQQSIEVATSDRDGLKAALDRISYSEVNNHAKIMTTASATLRQTTKCPKVTEAEGLAWFRQKLLKGDVSAAIPTSPPASSKNFDSSTSNNHHSPIQSSPTPFQPAGFGGLAIHSPKQRIRSASFSVNTMPCLGLTRSSEDDPHIHQRTPIRALGHNLMPSYFVAASHPSEQRAESHDYKRNYSQSNSFLHTRTPRKQTAPMDDTRITPKPTAPLDDIEIYSCNGLTPLGLEYICDPLPVLGSALRNLVTKCLAEDEPSDFGVIADICEFSVDKRRKRMIAAFLMDSVALIASKINLASLRYRRAADLVDVLGMLQRALEDIDSLSTVISQTEERDFLRDNNLMDVFGLLEVVGRLNVGTVLFRMNKVRDALSSFESANRKLEEMREFDSIVNRKNLESDVEPPIKHNEHHPHDDNRSPSNEYLLLVVRTSMSRISLRLNDPDNAEKICKLISDESKPHKKNNSRLLRTTSHGFGGGFARSDSFSGTTSAVNSGAIAYQHNLDRRQKWVLSVAQYYLTGLVHEARGETEDYKSAVSHYNHLLSLARVKLDHRHPYICSLLERRGAVLFEQRKLQCSMLSYLACLKILEHQQVTNSISFHEADLARILYAVARVLHDKEEYHDALYMYQRALACQRGLAAGRPSLDVITTLCNISRVHHLSGEIDEALATNKEVLRLATMLVGGKMDHPFLIHRLKVEGNILVEAGRLEDAMNTFIDAARRCCEDGRNRMISTMMGSGGAGNTAQEDADAGDSSVLSIRSAASLAHISLLHPAAAAG